jgi:hypothetical protein
MIAYTRSNDQTSVPGHPRAAISFNADLTALTTFPNVVLFGLRGSQFLILSVPDQQTAMASLIALEC